MGQIQPQAHITNQRMSLPIKILVCDRHVYIKVAHGQDVGEVGAPENRISPANQSQATRVISLLIKISYKIKVLQARIR